ncbi:MAG: DsbA family protein [Halanaeroarchaeum sp.]
MDSTRRQFLLTGTATTAVALAGCLGAGSSGQQSGNGVDSLPAPTLGPDDAPVAVAVYEDYACPHCYHYATETFPNLRDTYVGEGVVRYEHHDFPIPVDEQWSYQAPSAARAVQDEVGDDAFFEFSGGLWDNFGSYSLELLGQLADEVGADPGTVRDAATNETYKPVLEADLNDGKSKGVRGTPTVFVNGEALEAYDWQTVKAAVEAARQ